MTTLRIEAETIVQWGRYLSMDAQDEDGIGYALRFDVELRDWVPWSRPHGAHVHPDDFALILAAAIEAKT